MPRTKETRNPLGSIFKREIKKDGKKITVWDARKRYSELDENGKKIYKSKTTRCYSYSAAVVALGNLPAQINEKKVKRAAAEEKRKKEKTLFELVEYFRAEYVKPAVYVSGQKISGYRQSITTLGNYLDEFKSFFGDVNLSTINYERIKTFREHLAGTKTRYDKPPTISTLNKEMAFLNRVFNVGFQADMVVVNPFKKGKPLITKSKAQTRNRMMSFEEEKKLLAECKGRWSQIRFLIIAAVDTTMRRGEIWNLKWRQIDFERGVIYLTEDAAKETKTGTEGILPLTTRLKKELELKIKKLKREPRPDELVVGRVTFKHAWETVRTRAGVKDLQFRDLRSTGATRLLIAGVPGDLAKKATRHTRIETFHEHYTNVDRNIARDMALKLDRLHKENLGKRTQKIKPKAKVKAKTKIRAKTG